MRNRVLGALAVVVGFFALAGWARAGTEYIVANDDAAAPFPSGVSFYTIAPNGFLTLVQDVPTGGMGIGGGFFGANRIAVVNNSGQACVYATDASTGDIVGIIVSSLAVGGSATGSDSDGGTSNGIGLATGGQYLYASYSDSNTIGTFQLQPGCSLSFVGDVSVSGVQQGIINGMAIHGSMMVATYTDGTIESFDISGGMPASHGDKQLSTATVKSQDATYPNSIDITPDGHFAIFGDTSTLMVVEISDISSGKLAPTRVYSSTASISSSNVMLSPDGNVLYVVNTQGDRVTASFFNKVSGKLYGGCSSNPINGLSGNWSYLAGLALASNVGTGGGVYVAEFGSSPAIALVKLNASGRTCTLQEVPESPVAEPNSSGLLSIGRVPPRRF